MHQRGRITVQVGLPPGALRSGRAQTPTRAPDDNGHGDEILQEPGLDMDRIIELEVQNVIA